MNINKNIKYIMTSLFTAIICIVTVLIAIPIPGGSGYLNIGDAFSMLSALLLGPIFGTISTVTGCLLSDIITGYYIYIPATVLIKALAVPAFYFIYKSSDKIYARISAYISFTIIVTGGYFIYEYFIMGLNKLALISVPYNMLQELISTILSILLFKSITKITKRKVDFYV